MPLILSSLDKPKGLAYQTRSYALLVGRYGLKSKSRKKQSSFDLLNRCVKGGYDIVRINDIDITLLCSQFRDNITLQRACGKEHYP